MVATVTLLLSAAAGMERLMLPAALSTCFTTPLTLRRCQSSSACCFNCTMSCCFIDGNAITAQFAANKKAVPYLQVGQLNLRCVLQVHLPRRQPQESSTRRNFDSDLVALIGNEDQIGSSNLLNGAKLLNRAGCSRSSNNLSSD